ncbi:MAG TPA: hypothetical protein DCQ09_04665 [Alcanivorax sp.]|nr:hypothetical protein [Rhodobiaceae bacterium]MBO6544388.1 MAPEG family protein [Alphaproteobacteria bacterium]MDF1627379.1 MAPEG family protein [Parvibaculaceae bacterium]HAM74935.1 hypothetical protein [Alcanivorax sp.]|tara:strand:- start:60 stop:476 length:417 start_codon:yes stop_codon:yes gene_type:complete
MGDTILTPILILVSWTLIVWAWMYAKRIPAMNAAKLEPQQAEIPGALQKLLPPEAQRVANNYNHLHEQPTIFYALVVYSHLAGVGDATNITLAWAYVGLRIVHSLVQGTVNIVTIRFSVFALSSLVLIAMAVRNLIAL